MRLRLVFGIFCVVWIILITRTYYLSIKSNKYFEQIAQQNITKTEYLAPIRGEIRDAFGELLAGNEIGFSVFLKPHLRKNLTLLDKEISNLSEIFDQNITKIKKDYLREDSAYNQNFIKIIDFISYDEMVPKITKLSLNKNLIIKPTYKRFYPNNEIASHIIGYIGKSDKTENEKNPVSKITNLVGKDGIEGYYNEILQGNLGEKKSIVNAINQIVSEVSYKKPLSQDISLSLDLRLQKYIGELMGKDAGVVIVMNAKNGEILAAGSYPEYDLNKFITGWSYDEWQDILNHPERMLENKIARGLYSPGSIAKMSSVMAFLKSKKIDEKTKVMCDPYFELGGRKFRNHNSWTRVLMTASDAIKASCNTYFYRVAYDVGINLLSQTLLKMGFGTKTNIDLQGENKGIVPNPEWKKQRFLKYGREFWLWYDGDTLNTSIGQGNFLVTPVQVAKNTALIATGYSVTPHFLKKINKNEVEFKKDDILNDFEKSKLPYLRKAMWRVANEQGGTAFSALGKSKIVIAAKTGTAQVTGISQNIKKRMKEDEMAYFSRSHAWITSYAPFEDPKFVVSVVIEHGGHGGTMGGPIVYKIFEKLIELGYIKEKK